jgi:hypothetical protein
LPFATPEQEGFREDGQHFRTSVLFQRVLRILPFAQNGVGVGRDVEVRLTADRESAGVSVWAA